MKFQLARRKRKRNEKKNSADGISTTHEPDILKDFDDDSSSSSDGIRGNYSCGSDVQVVNYGGSLFIYEHRPIKSWSKEDEPASRLTRFGKDWMSMLGDNVKLSSISIPGSHDTGSKYGGMFVETQSWSIEAQLESGIRYFDIRCRREGEKFSIYHGFVYQDIDFNHVLETVQSFLESHPTETLLMRVKEECKPKDNSQSFSYIWDRYMNDLGYGTIMARNIDSKIPRLGSVRGKVVILRDERLMDTSYGIKYDRSGNSVMDVQDYYSLRGAYGISKKKAFIKEYILKARNGCSGEKLIINHCSATQIPIYTPSFVAKRTNQTAYDEIGSTIDTKQHVGIIVMDFPGEHLIHRILLSNFTAEETAQRHRIDL